MQRRTLTLVALAIAIAVLSSSVAVDAAGASGWKSRRIYQIMTDRFAQDTFNPGATCAMDDYCNGTFKGAQSRLDYIIDMGFDAIWISPVPVNYHKGYHGYWATDFFKINPHFGTEQDLKNFVNAAHAKGVWIMIDIVVNHVGPVGNDFTNVHPFNSSEYYHQECQVTQYVCETRMVHDCRLADLPDLNQTVPFVKQQLQSYVQWLINDFGFDGIRADTVMYIKNSYWADLQSAVGTFIAGEVYSDFACNLNYTQNGIDATLNYPLYYGLRAVYHNPSQSMRELGTRWRQMKEYPDPDAEVNFLDNQDNNRFLYDSSATHPLYRSALTHMYFTNGIPCVFYGTEQLYNGAIQGNFCRYPLWPSNYDNTTHMYQFLKKLNKAHKQFQVWKHTVLERWQDSTIYCYVRGPLLVCTTNQVTEQTRTIPNLPFSGKTMCNWLDSSAPCVSGDSTMTITIPAGGEPLVLYEQSA